MVHSTMYGARAFVGTVNIITYNPDERGDLLIIQINREPSGTAMADLVLEAITPKTWIWYWVMRVTD